MPHPIAVLISDIHFSLPTLGLATKALTQAVEAANDLEVPLIVAGDLHDTKANMRGECVNAMLAVFSEARTAVFIMRGNHDSINERSEISALAFLERWSFEDDYNSVSPITVVNKPTFINDVAYEGKSLQLIPYHHDADELRVYLKKLDTLLDRGSLLIMHQGLKEALPGEYIQDKSAITLNDVKNFRVVSGHYHARQTIENWSYLGSPFSMTFGEANDPEKGFSILMSDGSLKFVPTGLRKHIVVDIEAYHFAMKRVETGEVFRSEDLIKVKIRGDVAKLTKEKVQKVLNIPGPFRLDLIPDAVETTVEQEQVDQMSQSELLDSMIESIGQPQLKNLWKGLLK